VSNSFKGAVFQKCEHMLFIEHGVEMVSGEVTAKVVNGKRYESKGKTTTEKCRKMKTRPGGLWQGGETQDVKVRVPLQSEIVLPPLKGWETFVDAYDAAVKKLTATPPEEVAAEPTPVPAPKRKVYKPRSRG